jgi:RNA polymerase sigma factor (sigma-70 family)
MLSPMGSPGDASASAHLERLLAEFGPRLHAIVLARCPRDAGLNPDEVEQEVRLRLWQSLQGENVITHPASYLYRTAMSAIVDLLRRRRARPDLDAQPLEAADGELTQSAPDPVALASRRELAAALQAAVAALPERRRRPVQLHLQGFGFAEVAKLLQLTDATARNLIYRGMEDLRTHLREGGWDR